MAVRHATEMIVSGFIQARQTQPVDPAVRFERSSFSHGFVQRARQPRLSDGMCRIVLLEYQHGYTTEKVVVV